MRNYSVKINFLTILRRLLRLLHTTRTRESFSKLSEKRPSPPLMLFSPKFANSSTNYKSEKLIHSAIELYNKNTSKSKELEGYYEPIKLFSQNLSCFKNKGRTIRARGRKYYFNRIIIEGQKFQQIK